MIETTPFVNPFAPRAKHFAKGEVVETFVKNGKTYKRIIKK